MVEAMRELGAEVEVTPAKFGPGSNVQGRWRGKGQKRILMLAHMDTVFKEDTTKQVPFRIEGSQAYGPGVLHDKGGIAMGLMAVRLLREVGFEDYGPVTLMVTPDEEKASLGSRDLIRQVAREHDLALVLEFGSPDDKITSWSKGIGYLMLEVTGKASHAGAEPELGCNAAAEFAHQMLRLGGFGDKAKETTVNFTLMQGGERSNIIPEKARGQADVRVLEPGEFDRLDRDIARLTADKLLPCAQIKAELVRGRPPFPANRHTDALVERAKAIYREIGLELGVEGSGGGTATTPPRSEPRPLTRSDPSGGAHTLQEYIEIDRIAPRIYLLARLIMDVSKP